MPYSLIKNPGGSFSVVNTKTGYVHAKNTTEKKAKAQMRLLGLLESKERRR
jgi:cystathionine beta-lyase family protein involved in aluminum resistance